MLRSVRIFLLAAAVLGLGDWIWTTNVTGRQGCLPLQNIGFILFSLAKKAQQSSGLAMEESSKPPIKQPHTVWHLACYSCLWLRVLL